MIIAKNKKSIQQRLDIEVIGCKNNFKKHLGIDRDELLVPFADSSCTLCFYYVGRRKGLATMIFAVCENLKILTKRVSTALEENSKKNTFYLLQDRGRDIVQGDSFVPIAEIWRKKDMNVVSQEVAPLATA